MPDANYSGAAHLDGPTQTPPTQTPHTQTRLTQTRLTQTRLTHAAHPATAHLGETRCGCGVLTDCLLQDQLVWARPERVPVRLGPANASRCRQGWPQCVMPAQQPAGLVPCAATLVLPPKGDLTKPLVGSRRRPSAVQKRRLRAHVMDAAQNPAVAASDRGSRVLTTSDAGGCAGHPDPGCTGSRLDRRGRRRHAGSSSRILPLPRSPPRLSAPPAPARWCRKAR
jgi:hypothetical protein